MAAKFSTLYGRAKKKLDMDYIYREIQKGRAVSSIAKELHVSRSTIYRHHKEYQETIRMRNAEQDSLYPELGENPFL